MKAWRWWMIPFSVLLEWLEGQGWVLRKIAKPYRVFTKPGRLPLLVEVHAGGKVMVADDRRIREFVEADTASDTHNSHARRSRRTA
jgi:hypothetical protein